MLAPVHLKKLLSCAITESDAERARLESLFPADARDQLFGSGSSAAIHGDVLRIPYFQADGLPVIGDDGVPYVRMRVFDNRTKEELGNDRGKLQRYLARPGSGTRTYVPCPQAAGDVGVITEGEIKSIAAVSNSIPCVGIPGVTMWSSADRDHSEPVTPKTPIRADLLASVRAWTGIVVIADSDGNSNSQVRRQMLTLAAALRLQTRCIVAYAEVPGGENAKRGLDDWIFADGADSVREFLSSKISAEQARQSMLTTAGFVPLGFDSTGFFVWSVSRGRIEMLTPGQTSQAAYLELIAGGQDWCMAAYGEPGRFGGIKIDYARMRGDLIKACTAKGLFDQREHVRDAGVWVCPDNPGALVVNSSDALWRTDGEPVSRYGGALVYPASARLGITADTVPATVAEVEDILGALSTWRYARPGSDPLVILGWLCMAMVSGALPERPHLSITGTRGSGKSYLLRFVGRLLGRAGIEMDGDTTRAGIRQKVKQRSMALLIDEAESDGNRVGELFRFLRSAYSGAVSYLGTTDQTGREYVLRACGMVAGIVQPRLDPADETRLLSITLTSVNADAAEHPHALVDEMNKTLTEATGQRLFARVVRSWQRYTEAMDLIRVALRTALPDPRFIDTASPILAGTYIALNDAPCTPEAAAQFVARFDLGADRDRGNESRDEQRLWDMLMSHGALVAVDGKSVRTTIAGLIAEATAERGTRIGPYGQALGVLGMRVTRDVESGVPRLHIDTYATEFAKLFQGTRWEKARIDVALKRMPFAEQKKTSVVYIGSRSVRPLTLDISGMFEPVAERPLQSSVLAD